ncbi:hypothetical protein ARALYDRAFT_491493 [Arabidopsis lyrata subsp. lyrata]|uniref:Binding protein n=1 Tax=Arabidopsis lyrata subsp. lyrata TaxID=81972 RepID=D7MA59_ARALL|nr:hypothetical protein ARALYDRAFT_491493 [Arabidopsis lyrata subsp. lyrata]
MIMRSASSLDLNLRAAQKPSVPRVVTTARTVSASSPRVAKPITRASSDGNLYKIQSPESRTKTISVYHEETASYRVLEGSRLTHGGSNGGFGGRGGDGAGGGGGVGGGNVDGYYEEMIQRYPGDTLLLSNYARFLKETAMLSENGRDGELLSMYGDLIWKNHGDGVRAHSYFDQAVQFSPDDCHVLASYARFLWDAEEEEEEEESKHGNGFSFSTYNPSSVS